MPDFAEMLQARLMTHLTEQQDPRLVEEPVRFESEPYTVRSLNQKEIAHGGSLVRYECRMVPVSATVQPKTNGPYCCLKHVTTIRPSSQLCGTVCVVHNAPVHVDERVARD